MMLRLLLGLLPFLSLMGDTPAGDDNDPEGDDPDGKPGGKKEPIFTPEQQAEVNRIVAREASKSAAKARSERDAELAAEQAAAEAEAERERDEAAGKFESVKQSLTAERDAARSDLEAITTERDELLQIVRTDVDAAWEGLPAEVRDAYDGDAENVLERKRHMQRMKGIIDRLQAAGGAGGNRSPKPAGKNFDLDAEVAKAKRAVTF